jgi:hypothetical protein
MEDTMPDHDEMSNVPAAVLKQKQAADRLLPEPEPQANEPEPQPVDRTPVQDVDQPTMEPAMSVPNGQDETWKHKYSVLQGKYDKEIKQLRDDLVDAKAMIERQNVVIENAKQSEVSMPQGDIDPEDFDSWGSEMQEMVKLVNSLKKTVADQQATIASLQTGGSSAGPDPELQGRLESLEHESYENRVSNYISYLDSKIKGNWRQINKMPQFSKWLAESDPISLQPRLEALTAAADNLRGAQVASIFNLFIEQNDVKSDASVASEMPGGSGHGDHGGNRTKDTASIADLKAAEREFIQGKITQDEFQAISAKVQKSLRS